MPVFDTFTKRKRQAERAGKPDVYQYENLPQPLRAQVMYIWGEALGGYRQMDRFDFDAPPPSNARWQLIRDVVARERGVFSLSGRDENPLKQCAHLLLSGNGDDALEIIEASFRYIDRVMREKDEWHRRQEGLKTSADDAIAELNQRFKEHGVGYRYEDGMLIQIDSELLHAEATVPALRLLHEEGFEGALDEFMSAHSHYRKGEMKDANVDALNSLESTLKTICTARRWRYSSSATATDLVRLVVKKELIPRQLQGHFEHLIKAMETGLPPVRHNYGGHGQGPQPLTVADHLAAYSLHLMAANIVLLIEAHRALK